MSDTTHRVLLLLSLLQQRPVWTGPELAERLGVTTRSIRRDVERLRGARLPCARDPGPRRRLPARPRARLPPLLLDDEEAVAIAVSLRLAAGGTVTGASEAALSTLAKLDQVMPPRLRSEVKAIHDATETLSTNTDLVDGDLLLTLAKACRDLFASASATTARDGARPSARSSPCGSSRRAAGGTSWRGTSTATTGAPSGWTGCARWPPSTWRFKPREHPDPAEYVAELDQPGAVQQSRPGAGARRPRRGARRDRHPLGDADRDRRVDDAPGGQRRLLEHSRSTA